MELSPVSTVAPFAIEDIAVIRRRVVPEFFTSITSSGTPGFPLMPVICRSPSIFSILAPNFSQAATVARVSADSRGFLTMHSQESAPMAIARCV